MPLHTRSIRAQHFFNTAFKEFSRHDNVRSIPKLTDGLKPAQRKAIYGTLLRGEAAGLIQVERLAAAVAASTDYHHGTGSLASTIVGMANDYAGTNNLNMFVPEGQFGSRLTPESAATRYIETKLTPHFRMLFPKVDDDVLVHHENDGEKLEPISFAPLIPLVLVNGAQGTGTGHACFIMQYNPADIRDACIKILDGKQLKRDLLTPWFRDFRGKVERSTFNQQVSVTGILEIVNTTTIRVSELPVGTYLDQFKSRLNRLEDAGFIKDYDDRSTEKAFDFTITVPRSTTQLPFDDLLNKFGIVARDTENFTLWDQNDILKCYDGPEHIIAEFVPWRLNIMEKRRVFLLADIREQERLAAETIRFIRFYLSNVNAFRDTQKKQLVELLLKNSFTDYDRLLSMPIWSLTRDRIEELEKKLEKIKADVLLLEKDTAEEMYRRELKALKFPV